MALAFMLNPARKKRKGRRAAAKKRRPRNTKWARCMRAAGGDAKIASNLMKHGKKGCRISAKARKALKEKRAARKVGAKRAEAMRAGMPLPSELFKNPRRKRRGRKGGSRSMAKTKRKKRRVSAKRSRAAKKGWQTWKRRHKGRKPRVGRKGRRNNPRGRRRNLWRDDAAGHRKAAKKGWRRRKAKKNPRRRNARRRRNSMYSGRLYANPRRRRNARRRRNPFGFGGTFGQITKSLTDPKVLTQFAVGAAGASVSEMLGSLLTAKIASFSPETFAADPTTGKPSMVMQLLGAASRIATGVLVAAFLPSQYKMAWILGSGTVAAQPLISGLLKPVLDPIGEALGMTSTAGLRGGIGGWISAAEVYGMRGLAGRRGMGAWLTARQLPGVGVSGLGYGGAYGSGHYAFQPGMQSAFTM